MVYIFLMITLYRTQHWTVDTVSSHVVSVPFSPPVVIFVLVPALGPSSRLLVIAVHLQVLHPLLLLHLLRLQVGVGGPVLESSARAGRFPPAVSDPLLIELVHTEILVIA